MENSLARDEVILAALNVVQARLWNEAHPEDPHSEASIELADDMLDGALAEWKSLQP